MTSTGILWHVNASNALLEKIWATVLKNILEKVFWKAYIVPTFFLSRHSLNFPRRLQYFGYFFPELFPQVQKIQI